MNLEELGFIIILGVVVAFYLIFIRPARQDQKRHQATIRDLRPGDEVITTAGFFAHIKEIHTPEQGEAELILDLGSGIEIRAQISAVRQRIGTEEERAEQPNQAGRA